MAKILLFSQCFHTCIKNILPYTQMRHLFTFGVFQSRWLYMSQSMGKGTCWLLLPMQIKICTVWFRSPLSFTEIRVLEASVNVCRFWSNGAYGWCDLNHKSITNANLYIFPSETVGLIEDFLMPLQQTDFWKHSNKRRNCSERAISSFATMFATFSHRLSIKL